MVLFKQTGNISIRAALDMLSGMEVRDHVEFGQEWYTVPGLRAVFDDIKALDHCANAVKVVFWGGPPGREEWHEGTLRMFLLDQLFRMEADNEVFDMLIDLVNEKHPGLWMTRMKAIR